MEIKDNKLIIDIPKGMELDTENTDVAKGVIMLRKKKDITYDDILQAYATDFGGIRVPNHCIDKILAISRLMNIAKYYNGDWKPNWNNSEEPKYYIYYCNNNDEYKLSFTTNVNWGDIYFRFRDNTQSVIDNPNFRPILDAIYKD